MADNNFSPATTTAVATPAVPVVSTKKVNLGEFNNVLNDLSPAMQTYLKSFENKLRNSDLYCILNMEQKKSFGQIPMDIPVMVNGNLYDLQTLLDLPIVNGNGQRQELNTDELFSLREIQPARHIANATAFEFEKLGLSTTVPTAPATNAPAAAMFKTTERQQQTQVTKPTLEGNCLAWKVIV